MTSPQYRDLSGQRFGLLVAQTYLGASYWSCLCDCGKSARKTSTSLLKGNSVSCGCLWEENKRRALTKHGMRHTRTYEIWKSMRSRCENPGNKSYRDYGARGVRVCDRWQSFSAFIADMGECPQGYSIDRRDPTGNYEPSNCEWIPRSEQGKTSRRALRLRKNIPEILRLRAEGLTHRAIAARLGVSTGAISGVLAKQAATNDKASGCAVGVGC